MPPKSHASSPTTGKAPKSPPVIPATNNQPTLPVGGTTAAQPASATHSGPSSHQGPTPAQARRPQSQLALDQAQIVRQYQIRYRISAFQVLLVMFGRLCAEDYPKSHDMPEDFVLLKEWERGLPQPDISAATHFLRKLPHVHDPRSIPTGEQRGCMICSLPYHTATTPFPGPDYHHHKNVARVLPCGHYFCCGCLEHYIRPRLETPRDTCPFCRSVLFVNWLQFRYFTTTPGPVDVAAWADKDHDTKIQLFQNWFANEEMERSADFQRWQANSLSVLATTEYGATTYSPGFWANTQIGPSVQITPRLVVHRRARLELHLREKMVDFLRLWVQWMEDPTELRPSVEPDLVAILFKLRREQEWDPTGLHEANARKRVGDELYRPFQ